MRDYKLWVYLAYAMILFILAGIVGNAIMRFKFPKLRSPQSVNVHETVFQGYKESINE